MTTRRIRFEYDDYADWSWLEQDEFKGESPDDYVALVGLVEEQCDKCGNWSVADTLGGITFFKDSDYQTGTFTDPSELSEPYQREVAEEMLAEATA